MLLPEDQGPHDEEYKSLMNRLNRIEGQIRGLKGTLEKTPTAPTSDAGGCRQRGGERLLQGAAADHIRTCVAENIRAGNDEVIDELVRGAEAHEVMRSRKYIERWERWNNIK